MTFDTKGMPPYTGTERRQANLPYDHPNRRYVVPESVPKATPSGTVAPIPPSGTAVTLTLTATQVDELRTQLGHPSNIGPDGHVIDRSKL